MKSALPALMEAAACTIGAVADLQSSFSRPRQWCDAGSPEADQKAGVARHQWWSAPFAFGREGNRAPRSSIIKRDDVSRKL